MKSIIASLLLAGAAFAGTSAPAPTGKGPVAPIIPTSDCAPLSYNFGDVGWRHADFDGMSSDGAFADVSIDLGNNFNLDLNGSITDGDVDQRNLGAGVGYRVPLSESFHFVLRGGYYFFESETAGADFDENGFYLAPGFRAMVACNLELFAKLFISLPVDSSAGDEDVYLTAEGGLVYYVTPNIGLIGAFGHDLESDDSWTVRAGIRYLF